MICLFGYEIEVFKSLDTFYTEYEIEKMDSSHTKVESQWIDVDEDGNIVDRSENLK